MHYLNPRVQSTDQKFGGHFLDALFCCHGDDSRKYETI